MDLAPKFKAGNAAFQKALNDVVAYAKKHGVNPGGMQGWQSSPDGWVPPVAGSRSSNDLFLKVYPKGNGIAITPGVVTGLNQIYVPTIGGDPIDDSEPPVLEIAGTQTVYLKILIIPQASSVPGSSPTFYEVSESNFTVSGGVTVTTALTGQQTARVSSTSGDVESNGNYFIPLAKVRKSGGSVSVIATYMYGPIGVKFCSTGLLAVAPPVFVHSGDLQTLP